MLKSLATTLLLGLTVFVHPSSAMVDHPIHFVEKGKGPALIFLHGLGGDWTRWKAVIDPLSRNYRVIALDLLGFGRSDKPEIEYTERVLAGSLEKFMKDRGIGRATIVGNSMGAGVAYGFAVDHPERIERLIIVNGGPTRCTELRKNDDPFILKQTRVIDRESTRKYFEDLVFDKASITESVLDDLYRSRMKSTRATSSIVRSFVNGHGCLTTDEIRKIRVPTLFIWGKHDQLSSLDRAKKLHEEIPGSKLELIDDAAHLPHMEQPRKFVDALSTFLAS